MSKDNLKLKIPRVSNNFIHKAVNCLEVKTKSELNIRQFRDPGTTA